MAAAGPLRDGRQDNDSTAEFKSDVPSLFWPRLAGKNPSAGARCISLDGQ